MSAPPFLRSTAVLCRLRRNVKPHPFRNAGNDLDLVARSAYALRKSEVLTYVRALDPRRPRARLFILYAHYRTGTHLLRGLLNGHPRVYCGREPLIRFMRPKLRRVVFPKLFVRGCVPRTRHDLEAWGFNLKSDQLTRVMSRPRRDAADLLRWCHRNGWKIIYVYRKNVVRQAISDEVANARGRWFAPVDSVAVEPKIVLDPEKLLSVIRWFDDSREGECRSLEGIPCLTLSYEDDLIDAAAQRATMQRTFAFLGVENVEVAATTRKLSTNDLSDGIANYEQVAQALNGTKYAAMLGKP